MLCIVSRYFICLHSRGTVCASIGIIAVCQSLQWTTSTSKPRFGIASSTARQKNEYCSPSGVSPAVYLIAEILLIVNKVYRHAVEHQLFYPDVFLPPAEFAVKSNMCSTCRRISRVMMRG